MRRPSGECGRGAGAVRRGRLWDYACMANALSDCPPDRFAISVYCPCGHSAQIDYRLLPPEMWVNSLRVKLVCKVCGRRDPGIRIQWTGAGEFRYGAERPVDIGPHSAIDT